MESAYLILILLAAFIAVEVCCAISVLSNALVELRPGEPRKQRAEDKRNE